jgi:hypothetical protein
LNCDAQAGFEPQPSDLYILSRITGVSHQCLASVFSFKGLNAFISGK